MALKDVKDFVIRYDGHPKYIEYKIVEDDEVEVIIQKLEMLLFSNKGDVLGDENMGINLEYYLWQTNVTTSTLKNLVSEQITIYIPELSMIGYSFDLYLYEGTLRDILHLDFSIKGYNIEFIYE